MTCAWKELLCLLPACLRAEVDRSYRDDLQEVRLRLGLPPQLITGSRRTNLGRPVTAEDLKQAVNMACRYSPWTASGANQGYITAPGGHRVGLCGDAAVQSGSMTGFRALRSVNIRVARDFPGIARKLAERGGNLLIIGRPGCGKTTFLRDLARELSKKETVCVVDERGELFPISAGLSCFSPGNVDVLTGCSKAQGLEAVVRTMSPDTAAVDEITAEADSKAMLEAGFCGVRLLDTAHAGSRGEFLRRPVYKPLVQSGLFETLVVMQPDKSWQMERIGQ